MIIEGIKDLSEKEILDKIDELSRKYFIAASNPDIQQQIATAIDTFKFELQDRAFQRLKEQESSNDNKDLDNLIKIN